MLCRRLFELDRDPDSFNCGSAYKNMSMLLATFLLLIPKADAAYRLCILSLAACTPL